MKYVAFALLAGLVLVLLTQIPLTSSSNLTSLTSSSTVTASSGTGASTDVQPADAGTQTTLGTITSRIVRILVVAAGMLVFVVLMGLGGLWRRTQRTT